MEIVDKMTFYLQRELKLNNADASVVKYGLEVLWSSVVGIIAIIVVSWFLGVLKYALFAVLAASSLRILSGGAHSARLFNCTLLGVIVSPGIGLLTKYIWPLMPFQVLPMLFILTLFMSFSMVWKYAPADTPNKPITKPQQRKKLRILSFTHLSIWSIITILTLYGKVNISSDIIFALTLGIIWQSFSITPLGYMMVKAFDNILPGN